MENGFRKNIAALFHKCMLIERGEIFVEDDPIPINPFRRNATVMWPGVVGPGYRTGGLLMIGINPGGGRDSYNKARHGENDLYPVLHQLKKCPAEEVYDMFESCNQVSMRVQREWNIWKLIYEIIIATDLPSDGYAYLNAVPYRTRNDKPPSTKVIQRSWERIVTPQLELMEPGTIVALGKKAGRVLERFYEGNAKTFVIPRTNGDRYLSPKGEQVLLQLSMYFRQAGI